MIQKTTRKIRRLTLNKVPAAELAGRMARFRARMDAAAPQWRLALVVSKVNMYYFTGTMQDGILLIPRDGLAVLWVRRSHERALDESMFPDIRAMESYRDAAAAFVGLPAEVWLETEMVPLAMYARLRKYFPFDSFRSADAHISAVRAVKSAYELDLMRRSGEIHRRVLEDIVPGMLRAGVSEAEFAGELYAVLVREGHHGVARFSMFDMDVGMGQIGFGTSSIYPTPFNGPGGNRGLNPAAPFLGSGERRLAPGDLVFVDVGCGVEGYHTDKTLTYVYRGELPPEAVRAHRRCVEIQHEIAAMLVPGETPSNIYKTVMSGLDGDFMKDFMGFGARRVKFLGHGIGLHVDELPVLAEGFNEPLVEGMAFAVEPKKGIAGVGMVGVENTFLVVEGGGECITGVHPGLMPVE
jgi:Xaa-Pro dipeptidase